MEIIFERSSRLTRKSSGNRQSGRSPSGSEKRPSTSENSNASKRRKICDSDESHDNQTDDQVSNLKKSDNYCWICHKIVTSEDSAKFCCPACPRTYHNKCLKKVKSNPSNPVCECKWKTVDGSYSTTNSYRELHILLRIAFGAVVKENKYKSKELNNDGKLYMETFSMWPDFKENELLCRIIDFSVIQDKLVIGIYKCTGELYQDIKWIYHNSFIIGPEHKFTGIAQKLEKAIKQQLSYAEGCAECYLEIDEYSPADSFNRICTDPHDIVWAKLKGFPYWPAKCLRLINGHADVRFFGTHDKALVPFAQVYKISRHNPGSTPKKSKSSIRRTGYEQAMEQLSEYIRNYEEHCGTFMYFPDKTPLLPKEKPRSKKRQNKNKSQQHSSLNTDVPEIELEILDDPVFLSDLPERKASSIHPSFAFKNLREDARKTSAESAIDSNVVCQMTFIEESPVEINASNEALETASVEHVPFSDVCSQDSQIFIKGSQDVQVSLPSFQTSLNNDEIAQTYVSPSTSSPLLITSTHSLSRNFNDQVNDFSKNFIHDIVFDPSECMKNVIQDFPCSSTPFSEEEDDDIQIIQENYPKSAEEMFKSTSFVKTFCDLLFGNKPAVKKTMQHFQAFSLRMYLLMWIEINNSKLDDCRMLNCFYEKMCKKTVPIKEHNSKLKKENEELKKKNEELKKKNEEFKKINEEFKEEKKEFEKKNEEFKGKKKEFKKQIKALEESVKLKSKDSLRCTLYKSRNEKLLDSLNLYKDEVLRLHSEIDFRKNNYKDVSASQESKIAKLEDLLKEKEEELAENGKKLAEKDEILAEKDKKLAEKDEKLAEIEDKSTGMGEEKLSEKGEKLAEKEEKLAKIEKKLAEKEEKLAKIEKKLAEKEEKSSKIEKKLAEKDEKLAKIEKKFAEIEGENKYLKHKNEMLVQQQEKINSENLNLKNEIETLKELEELANERLVEKEKAIENLELLRKSEYEEMKIKMKNLEIQKNEEYEEMKSDLTFLITHPQKDKAVSQKNFECQTDSIPQKSFGCQTDFSEDFSTPCNKNLGSSIEHISQKTEMTNIQVVEFPDGTTQYTSNTVQNEQFLQQSQQVFLPQMYPLVPVTGIIPVSVPQTVPQTPTSILITPEPEQTSSMMFSSIEQSQNSSFKESTILQSGKSKSSKGTVKSSTSKGNAKGTSKVNSKGTSKGTVNHRNVKVPKKDLKKVTSKSNTKKRK